MACNAQTINVLNSLALTKGDKIVATPNFDVFMMYKDHRDAQALAVPRQDSESQVDTFASLKGAKVCVNLVNASYDEERLINLVFPSQVKPEFVTQLTADDPHACNTFEEPNLVRAKPVKANSKVAKQHEFELPAASVTMVTFSLC